VSGPLARVYFETILTRLERSAPVFGRCWICKRTHGPRIFRRDLRSAGAFSPALGRDWIWEWTHGPLLFSRVPSPALRFLISLRTTLNMWVVQWPAFISKRFSLSRGFQPSLWARLKM